MRSVFWFVIGVVVGSSGVGISILHYLGKIFSDV